jgi:hypothetical protein
MDEAPSQPIRRCDQHGLELPALSSITQAIQGWTVDAGTAVTLTPVHLPRLEHPALRLGPGPEVFELLRNGLIRGLSLG